MKRISVLLMLTAVLAACAPDVQLLPASGFQRQLDGKEVSLYTLTGGGLTAQITNYGARVVSLWTPDRNGRMADVVIGRATLEDYISSPGERFLGSSPGPVANRIGGACFELDGTLYQLEQNDNGNTLHGGFTGIDRIVWDVLEVSGNSILMQVEHPDGAGGFPGNKIIGVRYTLTDDAALKVEFTATTDAPTPVNLVHHPFFNLRGSGNGNILSHVLTINASATTPVDAQLIPTGEIVSVEGTPLDFREPHVIGERIDQDFDQLRYGHGYDHNWVIDRAEADVLTLDAVLYEPESGRKLEVLSDQPGMQFYSGYFFADGATKDMFGNVIPVNGALALETQRFPDSIHHPEFGDTVLRPGGTYTHTCLYRFSAE